MKVNKAQAMIGLVSAALLLFLAICPPWQEAAKNEIAYRKDIGRGFLWNRPDTISVNCYFSGCTTAPASYFHAVLNRKLLLEQFIPVLVVACLFMWLFRCHAEKQSPMMGSWAKRLTISSLLALLVPPTGGVPMGAALASEPMLFVEKGEFWTAYVILIPILYLGFVLAIYGLISAVHWLIARAMKVRSV